jgi:excisionase family DNA binding protein
VGAGLARRVSDEPGDSAALAGEVAVRPAREAGVDSGSGVTRGSASQVGGAGVAVGQVLLTAEQAGALLVVPGSWLRDKAAAGEVPCRRLGKHLRFSYADVDAIAAAAARPARVAPRPPAPRRGSRG